MPSRLLRKPTADWRVPSPRRAAIWRSATKCTPMSWSRESGRGDSEFDRSRHGSLRPLLLLLRGGEQHVVEDQPVAGRMRELVQLRLRVAHHVLVVLGVVAA